MAIVGDEDGHWLISRIEELRSLDQTVRTGRRMCFSFLKEGGEAVISHAKHFDAVVAIDMPAGSFVAKENGDDFDTWVFRVDNGYSGADRRYFDVAYREISTGDYLLYLLSRSPGVSGRRS